MTLTTFYQTEALIDSRRNVARHGKTIASIEQKLRDARDSVTTVKFNGQLEATGGLSTEIGKEKFISMLKEKVKEHG